MTAPVPISPSVARAVPASAGADQDPGSGASFASALDGALRPERADTARGRHDPDRGASDHARADRPLPRTRGTDSGPGLRAHGRKDDRRPHDPATGTDDETVPVPGPDGAAVTAAPPWTPALGLVPATTPTPTPTAAASDEVAAPGAAPVGTAATGAPAADTTGAPASPVPVDLSAPAPAAPSVPTTPPAALGAAELKALAAAVPQPTVPAAPPADAPRVATQATAPAPAAVPAAVPAAPLPVTAAAPATDDVPAAPDASAAPTPPGATAPGTTAAPVAAAAQSAVRTSDVAPAPADPASPAVGTAPAPGTTGIPTPSAGGSGGSASSDPGDQGRQDPTAVSVDTTVSGVGTPLPTVPVTAAAAAAAAAPVAAAPPPVATQLVQHVAVLADGPDGTRSVTVVLHPDSLGPVQVQVTLSQGAIDLTMRGAHEQGRAALMGALPDLRRDLESAGLTCSTIGVAADTGGSWTASNGSAQQQAAQQQAAQQWTGQGRGQPEWSDGRFRPWSRAADTGDSRPIPRSPRSTSPGVDVRV